MELINENDGKLDESWINDFEKQDNIYSDYYKSDVFFIKISSIYVDCNNEICKIKEENFFMKNPNIISKEELIAIIKKNSILNNKIYSLLSLLKYNINIEPQDIKLFLNNNYDNNFIHILKSIDSIFLNETINMFHELNNVIIVYYEKMKFLNANNNNNNTKKIYLKKNVFTNKHQKTIRR